MSKILHIVGLALLVASLGWIACATVRRYAPQPLVKPQRSHDAVGPQAWLVDTLGEATRREEIARLTFIEHLSWACGGVLGGGILLALARRRPRQAANLD